MAESKSRTSRLRKADVQAAVAQRPWPYQPLSGESRVWARAGYEGIAYSDGSTAERELLEFLRQAQDLGSLSDELAGGIDSWMREAHLSPARANLLRPLDWSGRARVLELGAGCGAITRYLGELGLRVAAHEGAVGLGAERLGALRLDAGPLQPPL